jgi:hypothetical protein
MNEQNVKYMMEQGLCKKRTIFGRNPYRALLPLKMAITKKRLVR